MSIRSESPQFDVAVVDDEDDAKDMVWCGVVFTQDEPDPTNGKQDGE